MSFHVRYTKTATDDLGNLNFVTAERIVKKITFYCATEKPLSFAIALHGQLEGRYRFRIGEYRAIFVLEKTGKVTVSVIQHIKHRKEVYE